MRHLRHQEHDDDTIYLLELYRHLRDWMSAIGIPDFGFRVRQLSPEHLSFLKLTVR